MKNKKRFVYLDHAASTPVDAEVARVMSEATRNYFGNPSSLHSAGQKSSAAVFKARRKVAELTSAGYEEIIFTGSATEANNLALRGAVKKYGKGAKIIVSAIEHESILDTARDLEREGTKIVYLPVQKSGLVDLKELRAALDEKTVLVSIGYANNEVGTIQPVKKISQVIKAFRSDRVYPLLHTDAVQALQYCDPEVRKLGVDLMTLSGHKIYGPKGIGTLYVKKNGEYPIQPIITGGGHELGLRSGTENVSLIAGFGEAIEIADALRKKETTRLKKLRDYFFEELKKITPDISLNGSVKNRLPNNLNVYFPEVNVSELLIALDLCGIAASAGSACKARAIESSYVLKAMGFSGTRSKNSIRFSLGRSTTYDDIKYTVRATHKILKLKT